MSLPSPAKKGSGSEFCTGVELLSPNLFPSYRGMRCPCSNNRIARIDSSMPECLSNLRSLVLTNNHLKHLTDIDILAEVSVALHLCGEFGVANSWT